MSSAASAPQEQRSAPRFTLHVSMRLRCAAGDFSTTTENLSASGILFSLPQPLTIGDQATVEVTLPAELTLTEELAVEARALITRCEPATTGYRIAATLTDLRTPNAALRAPNRS